jgi:glutathione S-transferase
MAEDTTTPMRYRRPPATAAPTMIQLHYFPGNASMTPHLLLEELGLPFELKRVDRAANEHKSPAYLKLNPNGLIPVLVDGELVLYETAAIVLHLVDSHPAAGLAPAVGTAERAQFYKWLVWLAASLQAQMPIYFYTDRYVAPGNAAGAAEVRAATEARIGSLIDQTEAHLASHGGPWFLGERFSALDPYAFMLCRWTRGMGRPARTLPHLGPYLQRMLARPAVQRVIATEGLSAPLV